MTRRCKSWWRLCVHIISFLCWSYVFVLRCYPISIRKPRTIICLIIISGAAHYLFTMKNGSVLIAGRRLSSSRLVIVFMFGTLVCYACDETFCDRTIDWFLTLLWLSCMMHRLGSLLIFAIIGGATCLYSLSFALTCRWYCFVVCITLLSTHIFVYDWQWYCCTASFALDRCGLERPRSWTSIGVLRP